MGHGENESRALRASSRAGVGVCERVSEVVDAVDASVKRAELN